MKIPQSILDKIAKQEANAKARKESERRAAEQNRKEFERIENLRIAQKTLLETEAKFIAQQLLEFWQDAEVKASFKEKDIKLFVASFCRGRPTTDRHAYAAVNLQMSDGQMFYYEGYNTCAGGHRGDKLYLGFVESGASLSSKMVNELHPDFLFKFADAIRSGDFWDFVEWSV